MDYHIDVYDGRKDNYGNSNVHHEVAKPDLENVYDDDDEDDYDDEDEEEYEDDGAHIDNEHRQLADNVRDTMASIIPRLQNQAEALCPSNLHLNSTATFSKEEEDLLKKRDAERDRFFDDFKKVIEPQEKKVKDRLQLHEHNLLYHLVANGSETHNWLFERAARLFPTLLCECNSENEPGGPLMKAITLRRDHFIMALLEGDVNRKRLTEAIGLRGHSKRNCIHVALKSALPTDVIIKLIERASEATLSERDQDELTPLHYAVEYERCTNSRLPIFYALLSRSDEVFDIRSQKLGMRSVFLYHVTSRKNYKAPKRRSAPGSKSRTRPKDKGQEQLEAPRDKDPREAKIPSSLEEQRQQLEQLRGNGYPQKTSKALTTRSWKGESR